MRLRKYPVALLMAVLSIIALSTAACGSSSTPSTQQPSPTTSEEPTREVAQTEEAPATQEADPDDVVSVSPGGEYYIAVSYTVDAPEDDVVPAPPEGQRWIIVVATLANQQGETVTVAAEHLALIDTTGNRYPPEPPDDNTQPPLVSAQLAEGESVLGLVRFAIPNDATPARLEWCVGGACDAPLQSNIP